jgi:lysophospholipase L1-like esterase
VSFITPEGRMLRSRFVPRRRSTHLIIAAVLLAGAASVAVAGPSFAGADPAPVYVALGDSYASGVGAPPEAGDCRQSPQSAAQLWANSHQAKFTFAACSGATTADVLDKQLGGLGPETSIVTITIGGNDVNAIEVAFQCLTEGDASCVQHVNDAEAIMTGALVEKLNTTYTTIRNKAPNAKLYVLGYPRPFELTPSCPQTSNPILPDGVDLFQRGLANHAADVLDQVIQDRAAATGATFVDVRSAFAGHGVCSNDPWIQGIADPIDESGHPNATGYESGYLAPLVKFTG